jgi:hypothetical protein
MHRWTAKLLLLVMHVPALVPVALAHSSQQISPHCARQTAKPAMQCHHEMAMPAQPSSEASFESLDNCCSTHDCCRGLKTSEWARPASNLFSSVNLRTENAPALPGEVLASSNFSKHDSARAPPASDPLF